MIHKRAEIVSLALIVLMFILFAVAAVAFEHANAPVASATPTPTPTSSIEAPAPTPATTEPAPATGDSPYIPSEDDCGPDGYRIEPGTCEWYATPTPTPTDDVEIGTAIYCEDNEGTVTCWENGVIVSVTPPEPQEDSPEFDCRIHGNHICGVEVEGQRYLLDFDTNTFTSQ